MFIDPLSCIQVAGSQYDYVWAAVHCPHVDLRMTEIRSALPQSPLRLGAYKRDLLGHI